MGRRATASTAASEPLRENLAVCCSSTVGGVPRATPRSSSTRSSAILVIQPSNMMQAMQRFGAAFPRSRAALLRAIACSRTSTTTSRSTCAARALLGKPLPPQQFFQRIARRCSPPQRRGCSVLSAWSARWHIKTRGDAHRLIQNSALEPAELHSLGAAPQQPSREEQSSRPSSRPWTPTPLHRIRLMLISRR